MLLKTQNLIRILSIVFAGTLISACSSKSYTQSYYNLSKKSSTSNSGIKDSSAMHRATMRPYQINGKWYHPTLAKVGDEFSGIASWYGPNFHQKLTSNGEIYDMYAQTAAHKTLPMNTMVKVRNLENGKTTIVRINDRGPFVSGRIIDLSNKAANDIDMFKKGTARVEITVLGFNAKVASTSAERQEVATVGKYYVQVGAFRRFDGAKITKNKFEKLDSRYNVVIKEGYFEDEAINRVWVSGFRSQEEAQDYKDKHGLDGIIIAE